MPPTATVEMAKGLTIYMVKASMSGREMRLSISRKPISGAEGNWPWTPQRLFYREHLDDKWPRQVRRVQLARRVLFLSGRPTRSRSISRRC
jgi:hypothetical protein